MSNTTPDEPMNTPAPNFGVGVTLRTARAKTGKSLAEVATRLRIRQPYLLALEEGRHKDLPGGTYAVGFLRTYGEFLGLDGEEMVRRFRAETSGDLDSRSELVFPSPVSEGRIPGGAVLFIGLLLAGLAYGGWYLLSANDDSVAEMVPSLPERLSSVLNHQASVTAAPPAETAKAKTPEPSETPKPATSNDTAKAPPSEAGSKEAEVVPPAEDEEPKAEVAAKPEVVAKPEPEPKPVENAKIKPQAETAKPAVEAPKPAETIKDVPDAAKPATTTATAAATSESRVLLSAAADDCWIQVREMDGQLLMSRLLRKGDSYAVPNRPGLTLMVGNAGALDISVDGKKGPSLGSPGQVRRDIRLDPDKLIGG